MIQMKFKYCAKKLDVHVRGKNRGSGVVDVEVRGIGQTWSLPDSTTSNKVSLKLELQDPSII